jgi:hypothetical protein
MLLAAGACERERPVLFYQADEQLIFVSRHREQLAAAFSFVADAALVSKICSTRHAFMHWGNAWTCANSDGNSQAKRECVPAAARVALPR